MKIGMTGKLRINNHRPVIAVKFILENEEVVSDKVQKNKKNFFLISNDIVD